MCTDSNESVQNSTIFSGRATVIAKITKEILSKLFHVNVQRVKSELQRSIWQKLFNYKCCNSNFQHSVGKKRKKKKLLSIGRLDCDLRFVQYLFDFSPLSGENALQVHAHHHMSETLVLHFSQEK